MARFKRYPVKRICDLCGRVEQDLAVILYKGNPRNRQGVYSKQIIVCAECGELIVFVATRKTPGTDRDVRFTKKL